MCSRGCYFKRPMCIPPTLRMLHLRPLTEELTVDQYDLSMATRMAVNTASAAHQRLSSQTPFAHAAEAWWVVVTSDAA